MTEQLWQFYLDTVVEVFLEDGRVLSIEQVPQVAGEEWPFEGEGVAWILTACNPRSVPLSDEENAARHQRLGEQLAERGYPYLETVGSEPAGEQPWSEPGYAVLGMTEAEVVELARSWDQNAIYGWTPDAWELLGVLLPGRTKVGWRYRRGIQ